MISLNNLNIIGHRGAPLEAPENTLASFKRAAELGIHSIEFDVQLTKDNELVIFHDLKLDRTTNGTGLVSQYNLEDLKHLEAGSWFSPQFSDEKIPTLIETIPKLQLWNLTPIIEIKCAKHQSAHLAQKIAYAVADCLKQYWTHAPWPMVSSFDHNVLLYFRQRLEQPTSIGFLVDEPLPGAIQLVAQTQNSALHCNYQALSPDQVQTLVKNNIPVFLYTINDKTLAETYLKAGATAIFTDNPVIFCLSS